jgi:hypothetical protein
MLDTRTVCGSETVFIVTAPKSIGEGEAASVSDETLTQVASITRRVRTGPILSIGETAVSREQQLRMAEDCEQLVAILVDNAREEFSRIREVQRLIASGEFSSDSIGRLEAEESQLKASHDSKIRSVMVLRRVARAIREAHARGAGARIQIKPKWLTDAREMIASWRGTGMLRHQSSDEPLIPFVS